MAAKRTVAIVLLLLGLAVALVPEEVPGFTVPEDDGTPEARPGAEMGIMP